MTINDLPTSDGSLAPAADHTPARPDAQLTDRQTAIYQYICDTVQVRGFAPSMREIGDGVGLSSTSSVAYQLKQLEAKGHIVLDPRLPRAYRIVSRSPAARIAPLPHSGCPLLADDSDEQTTTPLVLKVMLAPGMRHALLNGATLTVKRLPMPDTNCSTFGDADVLGQVTAISHPVTSTPA